MSLPSFLCIGAQKAATTWLYCVLNEHPDVWIPPIKELHYFDHLYVPENRKWTHWHLKKMARQVINSHVSSSSDTDLAYVKYLCDLALVDVFTESWYQMAFSRPATRNKILGEITPEYCTIPKEGVEYLKNFLGGVKLIYIIRDPFDRALSQIRMTVEREYGDKASHLTRDQLREAFIKTPILNRGDYKTYIPNWVNVFGSKRILFIPFRMIKDDPQRVMDNVEQHLALSKFTEYSSLYTPAHVTTKIEVPDTVMDPIEKELNAQRDYLRSFFEPEFYSMI